MTIPIEDFNDLMDQYEGVAKYQGILEQKSNKKSSRVTYYKLTSIHQYQIISYLFS